MQRKFQTWAEWPTIALLVICYIVFFASAIFLHPHFAMLSFAAMVLAAVLHSSLSHEMLHGHPFKSSFLNGLLVFPALGIFIPYLRFKDTHLAHHYDERLTDPFDDPETNYLCPKVWARQTYPVHMFLRFIYTLLGRMMIGPMVSQFCFIYADSKSILHGDRRVALGWLLHVPAVMIVWYVLSHYTQVTFLEWGAIAYCSMSILKIRTFLEHRANECFRGRTVVIEDRGILALLFLNNNFHAVHHARPTLCWFDLPRVFRQTRQAVLDQNHGYYFSNYRQIFGLFFFNAKDPVAHPLWSGPEKSDT